MRIFWDHAPGGLGQIYMQDNVCEEMRVYTDIKKCRSCGQDLKPLQFGRPRWVKHRSEFGRFLPMWLSLPPEREPLVPGPTVQGKFIRVRDFLIKAVRKLKGVELTATGQPRGILWVWWRLEEVPKGCHGGLPGTYLSLSPYYVPKVVLSRADWKMSRETSVVGFPQDIVPG